MGAMIAAFVMLSVVTITEPIRIELDDEHDYVILPSFDGIRDARPELLPPTSGASVAITPVLWTYNALPLGDGWKLNPEIHEVVSEAHGPVVWGRSAGEVSAVDGSCAVVCWAWDEGGRLVAIAAPLRYDEAAAADAPHEAMAEARGE